MIRDETDLVQDPLVRAAAADHGFTIWAGEAVPRAHTDILVPDWAEAAIARLNPGLPARPVHAAQRELRQTLAAATSDTLVEQAKVFLGQIRDGVRVDVKGRVRAVRLIDFDDPSVNRWDIATEVTYSGSPVRDVRFDIVLYCNGIPLVVTETKSMTDLSLSWLNAALDLAGPYTDRAPGFLAAGVLQIATDGNEARYAGVKTPAARFNPWGTSSSDRPEDGTWEQIVHDFCSLTDPARLLAWIRDYVLHLTDKGSGSLVRFVPRWPQAEAAPLIVERALSRDTRGLLDHFQGSGKTLTMLMAANAITRRDPTHCVVLVVDRLDLLTQHKGDFTSSDARRSLTEAETTAELAHQLRNPTTSGLVITTIHRFAESRKLSDRADITVLIDEAHRSQEGHLGKAMRAALPNATLIGLTGTPLAEGDRNTYATFGSPDDTGRVLHRYSAADSVADGTTVPLLIDRREIVQALDREALDAAFDDYVEREGLSSTEAEALASHTVSANLLFKDPRRVETIADDVHGYVKANLLADGYGAMLVVADRETCVLYANALKTRFAAGQVTAVISGAKSDPDDWVPYVRDASAEAVVQRDFRDPKHPLKVVVVTSKWLTGFDAKNCRVVFVDKPMRRHTLFQAVTRANRAWTTPAGAEKGYGVVIDYCGIAEDIIAAFDRSTGSTDRTEVATPDKLRKLFRKSLNSAEKVLGKKLDPSDPTSIHTAKTILARDERLLRVFRQHVNRADLIYETLAGDPALTKYKARFGFLLRVLHAASPRRGADRKLLAAAHGAAVRQLIREHTGAVTQVDLSDIELDADKIDEILVQLDDPVGVVERITSGEVLAQIRERLIARMEGPHADAYRSIAEKLERFAHTRYVPDTGGAHAAVRDLVEIVQELKRADELVGEEWEALEVELGTGGLPPEPVVPSPATALQDILAEFHPVEAPATVDDFATAVDEIVERLSYRKLSEDPATQQLLRSELLMEAKRRDLLPPGAAARTFVAQLVRYVNLWLV